MSDYTGFREIGVSLDGLVATVEIRRAPHNFFDSALIAEIGGAFERLDADPACRTIVLAAEGRSFCAGADFSKRMDTGTVQEAARSGAGASATLQARSGTGCAASHSASPGGAATAGATCVPAKVATACSKPGSGVAWVLGRDRSGSATAPCADAAERPAPTRSSSPVGRDRCSGTGSVTCGQDRTGWRRGRSGACPARRRR